MHSRGAHGGSSERFGYSWAEYSELLPIHEQQFQGWTALIAPTEWVGCDFLDAGCGMGRNSYWPLSYGARSCLAIDVDDRSLAAARRTLAPFPGAEVRLMSVYDIAAENRFDICFSIGVIHHLEHPERALEKMTRAAKRGGKVLIWVYGRENNEWIVRFVDPLRRALLSRMPLGLLHHLSIYPTLLLWAALRLGLSSRSPYLRLMRAMSFRHVRAIVFDQLLPRIANYWPRAEVERLMHGAGLADIRMHWVNQMSWCAVGTKP
ncbi:MAG: class I SAM-dependent methyltransferase [Rhodospirillaceae bacterium]